MTNEQLKLVYPHPTETDILAAATEVINPFAEQGVMLAQTVDSLQQMAAKMHMLVAIHNNNVIGTAAFTYGYPDGSREFGAWAVPTEYQKHGVGLELFGSLLYKHPVPISGQERTIAVTNKLSSKIMAALGASELSQDQVHPSVFEFCKTCNCQGKEDLALGRQCVDSIYDLSVVTPESVVAKLGHPLKTGLRTVALAR